MKVFAVIVTFNRLHLLIKVLDSIRKQSYAVDEIVVVNNDSSDGTKEWLDDQTGITIIHQANLGGAGGFSAGMRYAYENGADWIWTMDDDVFPESDALDELLNNTGLSSCLVPSRFYSDNIYCNWGGVYDLKRRRLILGTRPRDHKMPRPISFVNTCCFEGMLISRKIVEYIGFPDPRFFISGDDTIYGLLASQYTNVVLIESAILKKAKSSKDDMVPSPFYLYYQFRNFHLFEEYYTKIYDVMRFDMITRLKHFYDAFCVLCKIWKTKNSILPYLNAISRGLIDNCKKKTGKTF